MTGARLTFENPVTKEKFELEGKEADFFKEALERFNRNEEWFVAFQNFAFGPNSPIYNRKQSYGKLKKDPFYRALQDMWLQLGVNQGEATDDRKSAQDGFCRPKQ